MGAEGARLVRMLTESLRQEDRGGIYQGYAIVSPHSYFRATDFVGDFFILFQFNFLSKERKETLWTSLWMLSTMW